MTWRGEMHADLAAARVGLGVRRQGSTYAIVSDPYDGWAKIGRTTGNPTSRLSSCQTGNPRRLTLRATWAVDYEAELHYHYLPLRGNGEWFALPLELVDHMNAVRHERAPLIELLSVWDRVRVLDLAMGALGAGHHDYVTPERAARIFTAAGNTAHVPPTEATG